MSRITPVDWLLLFIAIVDLWIAWQMWELAKKEQNS